MHAWAMRDDLDLDLETLPIFGLKGRKHAYVRYVIGPTTLPTYLT